MVTLKLMLPKRRFWKDEQKMKSGLSIYFSMVLSPNRVLTPLKSASFENRIFFLSILPKSSFGRDTVEFYMHIIIQARLTCTLFDTAGMHAL